MARSSDVVKKVMRFKHLLSDAAEPATVMKILQKLKDLDITLDILSETGIGKTVNSLRRHKQAGEFAKLLVKGWKKLVPKESTSQGDDAAWLASVSVQNKEDDQSGSDNGSLPNDDNNNCPTSNLEDRDALDEQALRAKMGHQDAESNGEQNEPSMSFESYLNYDVNVHKKKEHSGVKRAPKMIKTASKELTSKDPGRKPRKSSNSFPEQKPQESLMRLMDVPLPAALPELEKPSNIDYYFEKKVEKEPDFYDVSEESAVFTGQRLNRKMQVYSGAKTLFLPTMMSLYQQCIRTLQNNLKLLYETGGVPFELLEPVLERCTPEQLLRIEEYNPIYIGTTDHLWGKHCQRDFKDCKLQEYESWKEMYIRLSEERERKLKRLTKTIVSAHSKKPKGRQVKMAFIHTVAKPPRDVRIQQEIHGTAVQQPQQLKGSVKYQENPLRSSCNEPNRSSSSSSSSGGNNNQDPRKKTKVAPMMAKSLKAFKKQLGRR
ncbi:hypothetical protein CHARACLAT_008673 [Characodon lateralis]|uniref:TFIIS N-terminal domain-containing protein n=1 Tax=Characodon lateralis TaxID=208331 RepID=A0ABU7DYW7_9TELE|nr:hypothetical protein [Characodon lateralis]